ncbi:GntR family transcriptional regulator [Mesorhizobium sp. M4B.F.Ca.ET.190.01.1.1]|uniref:GntR family transcriptional regulator n=1 Tax=unclassified Mesorhizobium TaxID=325217 RepID=UPI000FC99F76|nr:MULTISPECIES: GntR family transcriptional regulator [unclassified Mesorhizobium]RUW86433.1 GntR family transcriptional regulator [Mesorhizobium sp. M1E.F.Ca.ET.063.01.1.1]RWF44849.1 MAG: GntR family transcriptional regulator [Mesorhizobium sp.]TGR05695.1 GntR family transcriptional regulator [Mesorhizobium sp. M4B.F.Ca.ET.200.01.1.1]TGS16328.1 GntR family transcriptional regulator [Mesorhizobium sp. M4B.F.Ca.ET.190.01.1.1]TGT28529.1 GntR family transcriptional regulator [Mesorhizobium sp. M
MWFCKNAAQCRRTEMPSLAIEAKKNAKADAAYDAVLQLLYSKSHMPGQHLSDKELASDLNIGRTPIREALIRLAAEGKIVSFPQRGYFTRPLVEWVLLDSYVVARETLTFALTRTRTHPLDRTAPSGELSPTELALRAEEIFTDIALGACNCEICHIIDKFCFCSHALRIEITASELSPAFRTSLARLTDAMPQLGKTTSAVASALTNHLDVEQRAVSRALQNMSRRQLANFTFTKKYW